ncbi:MAG: YdcF family protein [Hyphomicrobiaceae bacterium]
MLFATDSLSVGRHIRYVNILLIGTILLSIPLAGMFVSYLHAEAIKVLSTSLETRIPRVALHRNSTISGMIVLGGQPSRVRAAMSLSQRFPEVPIILTGPGEEEIELAKHNLDNLIIEARATDTFENALYSRLLFEPKTSPCWLLITSAIHMPRALGVFQAAGLPVAPWPVRDAPQSVEETVGATTHEALGLIAYWLLGRTSELYPQLREKTCHDNSEPR